MLDIKFIRENKEVIRLGAKKKHINFDVDRLIKIDDERRELLQSVEKKRAEQNDMNLRVVKASQEEREQCIAEMKILKELLQKEEEQLKDVMKKWQTLMLQVPNIPDISVPDGKEDSDNQEITVWGEKPQFDFTPKSHIELMEAHGMVDFKRGTKVSGFRGYLLTGDGARLAFALWQFALQHVTQKGYNPMLVPSLVNKEPFIGTGYLPQSEDDLYKTQDDQYLSGTAEVATMGAFMDDMFDVRELPKKAVAFSPCFRREAGSHGKDTKGLMRVHEFHKVEQVILCEADHQVSVALHEELRANAEEMMQALGLPYHVVLNCGGDLGLGQVKKYDIEAWVPSESTYRETHSASYFHDFQTRRLNIRYKDSEGVIRFAHSLNNTALATPRILIPLIENNQNADGTITIPEVLRVYMGKEKIG